MSGTEAFGIDSVIGIGSGIFAGIGLIYTGLSFREDAKSRHLQTMKELDDELTNLEGSDERIQYPKHWGVKYLNTVERIAYLADKKIIRKDMARYFDTSFSKALGMLESSDFSEYGEDSFENLRKWSNSKNIKAQKVKMDRK